MRLPRRIASLIALGIPSSYLLWIVFVGTFSAHELMLGMVATILTVVGICVIDVQYPARFSPKIAELMSIWRLPWYLASGTWAVLKLATTDLLRTETAESLFLIVPFNAGAKEGPRAVARRVLAVTYSTMTPETIVLGINTNTRQMLLHANKRGPIPKMTQSLGARP
jgi:hypothetical protein